MKYEVAAIDLPDLVARALLVLLDLVIDRELDDFFNGLLSNLQRERAMMTIRRSDERGHFNHGWLDTRHTFSFADYHDRRFMGFRSLRVMNEDIIQPGRGFGEHGHRDMEILTYVLEGRLEHRDSLGNGSVLTPGELQRMSAGRGIRHSEFNPSPTEAVHLYQIWLIPDQPGIDPDWEQKRLEPGLREGELRIVASSDGRDGSLRIRQDADVHLARLGKSSAIEHIPRPGRHAWLQVLRGRVTAGESELIAGDGAAYSEESAVRVRSEEESEIMLFDLG